MIWKKTTFGLIATLLIFCASAQAQQETVKTQRTPQDTKAALDHAEIPSAAEVKAEAVTLEENSAWHTDLDAVLAMEDKQGKDLFLYFNASDWAQRCHVLNKDIFQKQEFVDKIQEDYILVVLDWLQHKEMKNEKRMREIMEQYRVNHWPTILLMDGDGKTYARSAFLLDVKDPDGYIEHYKSLKRLSGELATAIETVKTAEDEAIDAAYLGVMEVLEACDAQELPFKRCFSHEFPRVNEMLHNALKEDPDNERGLKFKTAMFLIKWGDISEPVCMAFMDLDPWNENGQLEQLLEAQVRKSSLREPEGGREILSAIESFYRDRTIKDQDRDMWIKYIAGYINYRVLQDKAAAKSGWRKP